MNEDKYLSRETVTSSAQAFTTSWVDLGSEIETLGIESVGVWVDLDINNTNNPRIRAQAKLDAGGAAEYDLVIKTVGTADVKIEDLYYEWNVDADQKSLLQIDLDGLVPYIQLQIQCGTVGAAAGEIESCVITKR